MLSFVSTFSTFGSDLASTFGSAFLTGSLALGFSVTTGCSVDATSTFAAFSASSLALILAKIAGSSTTAFPANVRGWSSLFFFADSAAFG